MKMTATPSPFLFFKYAFCQTNSSGYESGSVGNPSAQNQHYSTLPVRESIAWHDNSRIAPESKLVAIVDQNV
jgi:hypothetical protein